mgnify:FL=1
MTLGFEFHPEALAEFDADVDWYDEREFGLGGRFADEVRLAIKAACDSPQAWTKWPEWDRYPTVRSTGVEAFPYRVVYFVEAERLVIVAVSHSKRRPRYWQDRIGSG